jgi:hypothetical protein
VMAITSIETRHQRSGVDEHALHAAWPPECPVRGARCRSKAGALAIHHTVHAQEPLAGAGTARLPPVRWPPLHERRPTARAPANRAMRSSAAGSSRTLKGMTRTVGRERPTGKQSPLGRHPWRGPGPQPKPAFVSSFAQPIQRKPPRDHRHYQRRDSGRRLGGSRPRYARHLGRRLYALGRSFTANSRFAASTWKRARRLPPSATRSLPATSTIWLPRGRQWCGNDLYPGALTSSPALVNDSG